MFSAVWHFIVDSWHAPRRARLLYVALAAGFVGMAIAGGLKGDALVAVLGTVFALVTTTLAVLAPRLAAHFGTALPPERERYS